MRTLTVLSGMKYSMNCFSEGAVLLSWEEREPLVSIAKLIANVFLKGWKINISGKDYFHSSTSVIVLMKIR